MSEVRRWSLVTLLAAAAAGAGYAVAPRTEGTERAQTRARCARGLVLFRGACVPRAACPPGRVALDGVCLRIASPDAGTSSAATLLTNAHTEHDGTVTSYQIVARGEGRPTDYSAYHYPVAPADPVVTSGFDLHLPDSKQRRGNPRNPVGHGGLDLARPIGTPIASLPLEGQSAPTRVLFEGMLFGRTVATVHERPDGTYVAIHGHMSAVAPGIVPGAVVDAGALLGAVGDSWTPGVPHLHYELRWVRPGVDAWTLWGRDLWDNAKAVPVDPRGVLPLAPGR